MNNRLHTYYLEKVLPAYMSESGIKNQMAVPVIKKVVINVGMAEPQNQKQALESMGKQLESITGQKPKINKAKLSIAGFKLRQGDPIGMMVTLRGERMYQFLDKLINIVLPQLKDFQGISSTAFDQAGNYNLGLKEQIIFPEIEYDKIDKIRGLQMTIVTTAKNKSESYKLLQLLGMPFTKDNEQN